METGKDVRRQVRKRQSVAITIGLLFLIVAIVTIVTVLLLIETNENEDESIYRMSNETVEGKYSSLLLQLLLCYSIFLFLQSLVYIKCFR